MRWSSLLLAAGMLALSAAPYPSSPAAASCAGPMLEAPSVLKRGEIVTVQGEGFVDGCQDSIGCTNTFGCQHCEPDDPDPQPRDGLVLRLVQGDQTWDLAVTDADDHADATWTFSVPPGAEVGRARLETDYSAPIRVRIG